MFDFERAKREGHSDERVVELAIEFIERKPNHRDYKGNCNALCQWAIKRPEALRILYVEGQCRLDFTPEQWKEISEKYDEFFPRKNITTSKWKESRKSKVQDDRAQRS